MTSATPIGQARPGVTTRAAAPRPNHSCAGLSRVKGCCATSASGVPNGLPTTLVAHWYTGSAPGTSAGKRTRSSASWPIEPSTRVRNSTRSAPSHRIVSWLTRSPPRPNPVTSREPMAQRSARTGAGPGGGPGARALGGQQPRPLAPARVIVVLVGEHELVSRPAQQPHDCPPVQDPDRRAAPARIGLDQERMIRTTRPGAPDQPSWPGPSAALTQ